MNELGDSTTNLLRASLWRLPAAALFWWCLTEGAGGWYLGIPAMLVAVAASLALAPPGAGRRIAPAGLLRFAGVFVLRSIGAGLQVARYAFAPRPALRPGFLEIETTLPPGLPRVLLANTLTLQPGTLSVALDDARVLLHVLDETRSLEPDVRALEGRIAAMLGPGR